jgi:hypothetical protein
MNPSKLSSEQMQALNRLKSRIDAFRRSHSPRTKFPPSIVDAAKHLLALGLPQSQLVRACKVSSSLVYRWQKDRAGSSMSVSQVPRPVSVLTVVDEQSETNARHEIAPKESASQGCIQFTMQSAEWTFCVRLEPLHINRTPK